MKHAYFSVYESVTNQLCSHTKKFLNEGYSYIKPNRHVLFYDVPFQRPVSCVCLGRLVVSDISCDLANTFLYNDIHS